MALTEVLMPCPLENAAAGLDNAKRTLEIADAGKPSPLDIIILYLARKDGRSRLKIDISASLNLDQFGTEKSTLLQLISEFLLSVVPNCPKFFRSRRRTICHRRWKFDYGLFFWVDCSQFQEK
tara:strand:- start:67 stop:435 length:369 start_codon:yes stop_codon:yes gene_type:complete